MYGFKEFSGFSPFQILQLVDQVQIFQDIFNLKIEEKPQLYLSPFREDKNPRCFFEYSDKTLFFIDFGDHGRTHRNCIHAFKDIHNLNSYPQAAQLIYEKYLEGTELNLTKLESIKFDGNRSEKSPITISFVKKDYTKLDKIYWSQFGITPDQLIEDNVYSIQQFRSVGGKKSFTYTIYKYGYAIDFIDGVKIYQPYSDKVKWYTNCHQNHIGNFDNLPPTGEDLLITKSYKDHRVLRNLFPSKNIIWFQNEGCSPDEDILMNMLSRFTNITLLYDNDDGGTISSNNLKDYINSLKPNSCNNIFLPKREKDLLLYHNYIKDTAEFYKREGKQDTIQMLNEIGL